MRYHAASTPDSLPPAWTLSLTNQITAFALEMTGTDCNARLDSHTILTELIPPNGTLAGKRVAGGLGAASHRAGATLR